MQLLDVATMNKKAERSYYMTIVQGNDTFVSLCTGYGKLWGTGPTGDKDEEQ